MSESVEIARAARRTGLIFLGIIIAALTMVLAWLIPEARRIARDRDTRVNDGRAGSNMVRVPGGAFTMGANDGAADEQPLHDVRVSPFWMDRIIKIIRKKTPPKPIGKLSDMFRGSISAEEADKFNEYVKH